jgi:hypothetical protein
MQNNWFARAIGIVPLGIGLTVIGFLWGTPFNSFHSPPLFFRIFGSFIALAFVMVGGAILFGKHSPRQHLDQLGRSPDPRPPGDQPRPSVPAGGYTCSNCSAPLGKGADVSPHGDVKCAHCGKWFNVHHA